MQLVGQFLGESMLLGRVALAAALVVLEVVLPVFNTFSGKTLTLSYLDNGLLLLALGGIMLFIGLPKPSPTATSPTSTCFRPSLFSSC